MHCEGMHNGGEQSTLCLVCDVLMIVGRHLDETH